LLKTNYKKLRECLPQDHKVTIERLKTQVGIPEERLHPLMEIQPPEAANESIFMSTVFSLVKEDSDIFKFLGAMEILADSNHSKQFLGTLRQGMLLHNLHYVTLSVITGLLTMTES